jgi:uncharacterized protein Yka (UPF0111/DUF47 family)
MIKEASPVFVKIDKYKEIIEIVEVINKKIANVKRMLTELDQLKNKEQEEILMWEKGMDDITRKLNVMEEELSK